MPKDYHYCHQESNLIRKLLRYFESDIHGKSESITCFWRRINIEASLPTKVCGI